MNGNLLRYSLKSGALVAVLWAAGAAVVGLLNVALAPSFESVDFAAMFQQMPEALQRALGAWTGDLAALRTNPYLNYMAVQHFSFWIPLTMAMYPLFSMGGTLAREAERGTLGPLLAQPVERWKVATTKYLSFVLWTFLVVLAAGAAVVGGEVLVGIKTPLDRGALLQVYLHLLLFLLAVGALALAFSALFLAAGKAWGAMGGVLFLSFLFNIMAGFEGIAQAPKHLSLLYYWRAPDMLREGGLLLQPALVYGGVAVIAFVAALVIFQRREIPG